MRHAKPSGYGAVGLAVGFWLGAVTVGWGADDLGVVMSLHGRPLTAGQAGEHRVQVLQGLVDGEAVRFGRNDGLVVCYRSLGTGFRIDGPGTVSLTPIGITTVEGAPSVVSIGPCQDSTAADSNGGVILRGFGLRKKAHPDAGQP